MAISKRDKIRGVTWLDNNSKDLIKISFMKSTENIVTNIKSFTLVCCYFYIINIADIF